MLAGLILAQRGARTTAPASWVGHAVFSFMFRRPMFSILHAVFQDASLLLHGRRAFCVLKGRSRVEVVVASIM